MRLEQAARESREVDYREAPLHVRRRQHLGRKAQLAVRGERIAEIGFLAGEEEQHSARREDRRARPGAQRLPLGQRFGRHPRVQRVLAVSAPDQARLPAGGCPAVRRPPGIDQGHAMARGEQMMRRPRPEHARADDDRLGHASVPNGSSERGGQMGGPPPCSARKAWRTISACCSSP